MISFEPILVLLLCRYEEIEQSCQRLIDIGEKSLFFASFKSVVADIFLNNAAIAGAVFLFNKTVVVFLVLVKEIQ